MNHAATALSRMAQIVPLCVALHSGCFGPSTNSIPEIALAAIAATWYPPSLPVSSGLTFWLDASNANASGNSVVAWNDAGPNALHMPMDTGAPTLVTGQLNGLPVIRFPDDPAVVGLRRSSGSPFGNTFSFFSVFRIGSSSQGRSLLSAGTGCFSVPGNLTIYVDTNRKLVVDKMSDGNIFIGNAAIPTNVITSAIIISNSGGGTTDWYLSGTQDGNTAQAGPYTLTPTIFVGTGCNTGAGNFAGDIAEIIMYSRVISGSERMSLECYAQAKYGVSISHSCP